MVDIVARALSEGMKKKFPKGIGIVTRPGGGGSLAVAELVGAKPDGYTIILAPLSTLVIHPQLNDLPYKTPDDYEPIINVVSFYSLVAVKGDAPWKTAQEFMGAGKASPGKLRVGSPGEGTSSHLNFETMKRMGGVNLTHVPFSGWGESSPALLGGHVEGLMAQPGEVKPLVDGGKMRVLLVSQTKRHPAFPDAPTAKELGLGGDKSSGAWFIFVAPKGTPAARAQVHPRRRQGRHGRAAVRQHHQAARDRHRLPRRRLAPRGPMEGVQEPHRDPHAAGHDQEEVGPWSSGSWPSPCSRPAWCTWPMPGPCRWARRRGREPASTPWPSESSAPP